MMKYRIIFWLPAILISLIIYSCASQGVIEGGEPDFDPPILLKANPSINSLNVKTKKIDLIFDEIVQLQNQSQKIIVSPPQTVNPEIKSIGKRISILLNDDLIPNTTYNIDFTDAIQDFHEGNTLENFSYSFSTGSTIDSLQISGYVLDASNLEPISGIVVGIHSNLQDSAFTTTKFDRLSKTDDRGFFCIKGVGKGEYKIYALNDQNRNYFYDNPAEDIAFLDSTITPSFIPAIRQDTLINPSDSTIIDSIKTVNYTRFLPDEVILRSFSSKFSRQYLQKTERLDSNRLSITFGGPTSRSKYSIISPIVNNNNWYSEERNIDNDSIILWIKDPNIYNKDTLKVKIDYYKTDSLNVPKLTTDTALFIYKKEIIKDNTKDKIKIKDDNNTASKDNQDLTKQYLNIETRITSPLDTYSKIYISVNEPIEEDIKPYLQILIEKDSLYYPIEYKLDRDTLNNRVFCISNDWELGANYKLEIDSAKIKGDYSGLTNKKIEEMFSIKKEEEYGNLLFNIFGLPDGKDAYVELLDKDDNSVRKVKVKSNKALFLDLNPGENYFRLFVDNNSDGVWTSGDYAKKIVPEPVYYFPKVLTIKAFADHEENWNILSSPVEKQKPLEIKKNKPEDKENSISQRKKQEKERRQNSKKGFININNNNDDGNGNYNDTQNNDNYNQ